MLPFAQNLAWDLMGRKQLIFRYFEGAKRGLRPDSSLSYQEKIHYLNMTKTTRGVPAWDLMGLLVDHWRPVYGKNN